MVNETLSKRKGGLGIKDLKNQNNSFLMKWLWESADDDKTLERGDSRQDEREGRWTINVLMVHMGLVCGKRSMLFGQSSRRNLQSE